MSILMVVLGTSGLSSREPEGTPYRGILSCGPVLELVLHEEDKSYVRYKQQTTVVPATFKTKTELQDSDGRRQEECS